MPETSQFGLVRHDAITDELVESDRQGHQSCHTWDAPAWQRNFLPHTLAVQFPHGGEQRKVLQVQLNI